MSQDVYKICTIYLYAQSSNDACMKIRKMLFLSNKIFLWQGEKRTFLSHKMIPLLSILCVCKSMKLSLKLSRPKIKISTAYLFFFLINVIICCISRGHCITAQFSLSIFHLTNQVYFLNQASFVLSKTFINCLTSYILYSLLSSLA